MRIALASDHAGYEYKVKLNQWLESRQHEVVDFGPRIYDPTDAYPVLIHPAAQAVASGQCERGIILGGSGNGEAIVANKVQGIRCALAWNVESARLSRQHNDANVLSLGQRLLPLELALEIVEVWLNTQFEGGRHLERIKLIRAIETSGHNP
jgi:ribose 5-phosphate isomerase B